VLCALAWRFYGVGVVGVVRCVCGGSGIGAGGGGASAARARPRSRTRERLGAAGRGTSSRTGQALLARVAICWGMVPRSPSFTPKA
jgi:hypothetical protein